MGTVPRLPAVMLCVLLLLPGMLSGQPVNSDIQGTLTIVTPYPAAMTRTFRNAFQSRYPQIKVVILKKKTTDALDYIERTAERNTADLFWASSPAPFEILKNRQLLQQFDPDVFDLPEYLGSYPLNDPDGYHFGFAGSGFGMMWNTRYLKAKQLPAPKSWRDLASPHYAGHIGMSAPSRSGTTHIIVESILQEYGWSDGWNTILYIAGNLGRVTEDSYAVPVGVGNGEFGLGLVIDYYGLSAKARYYPIEFAYPEPATILPASIAILKNSTNEAAAAAFIKFLLTPEGQVLLLNKNIRRLPVRAGVYRSAPGDYPNPHKDEWLRQTFAFDVALSKQRYDLVNALFDILVTNNFDALVASVQSIHRASSLLEIHPEPKAAKILREAKAALNVVPVDEALSQNETFTRQFNPDWQGKQAQRLADKHLALLKKWDRRVKRNYERAKQLADDAHKRLSQLHGVVEIN